MGRWLAEFQENTLETGKQTTDSTDTSHDLSVLSVPNQGLLTEIDNIAKEIGCWNPELADQGYVWCIDCQYFNGVNCDHTDNPFRTITKCKEAPRLCRWYEVLKKSITE